MSIQIPVQDDLELRQRHLEDAEELFALTDGNRVYLRQWLPWLDHCKSPADTRTNIETSLRDAEEGIDLAVCIWQQGRIVGVTGYNGISRTNRVGHIGYWLGEAHIGTRLIVAFNNGDLCNLSIPDLVPGRRLERAHPSAIESLTLSPDGRLLVTGGVDRKVVFRDPVTFEPLLAFPEWTAMVKDLAFTPSGRHLTYVGADSAIALWDLNALDEGLAAVGLAWDQPAPVPAMRPAGDERIRPAAPIIRDPSIIGDPAALN